MSSIQYATTSLIEASRELLSFSEELWNMSRKAHGQRATLLQRLDTLEQEVRKLLGG